MITYISNINGLTPEMLQGFFLDWPDSPSPAKHLEILQNSYRRFVALSNGKAVGFITAISDGAISAYIPFLEVLSEFQHCGIGKELMKLMLDELSDFYMIDLVCDDNMKGFYEKFGMNPISAMGIRNYQKQRGK